MHLCKREECDNEKLRNSAYCLSCHKEIRKTNDAVDVALVRLKKQDRSSSSRLLSDISVGMASAYLYERFASRTPEQMEKNKKAHETELMAVGMMSMLAMYMDGKREGEDKKDG